jgi:hypothetical protein
MIKSLATTLDGKLKVTYPNGESKDVPFLNDFKIGINELSENIINNVISRPRKNDKDCSYFINFSGGLGDCLMLLEVLFAFREYLEKGRSNYEFIILISEDRSLFFKPLFQLIDFPFQFIVSENAFLEEIEPLAKYEMCYLPSSGSDARVEHLSIGNYRDYTWAIWGIPGTYSDYRNELLPVQIFNRLQSIDSTEPQITNKTHILIYPRGFGKANEWKTWPNPNWVAFFKMILSNFHEDIIIFDADQDLIQAIQSQVDIANRITFYKHQKDDDVTKMTSFFQNAKFIVSIDTGPAHFAGFFKVPCVVLWGPTNPVFYQHPNNINVRLSSCPPCFYSQRTELCNDNICMKVISPTILNNLIKSIIKR